jgi:polyhydroxyalkanoate synthesis regulator phasin
MNFTENLNPYIISFIAIFVGLLSYFYLTKYQRPGAKLEKKLKEVNLQLSEIETSNDGNVDLGKLKSIFNEKPLMSLWQEYSQSLHVIVSEDGERSTIRSTVPAEMFFSKESIVDSEINAEFFRHLPGMLTGVGIIGTFTGLVWGLASFNAKKAAETLDLLLGEVMSAFLASWLAILAAILITFFEKRVINNCYKQVDQLTEHLDGLFSAGVGEDYLARLVKASESSATHAASLKDALMRDLEVLMNRQAVQIGTAISGALEEPLKTIGGAVNDFSKGQGQAVSGMLENLLAGFMEKLDQTFGSQIKGINEAIQKSSDSMTLVQAAMTKLIDDISKAGKSAATEMSMKMEESMQRAAQAQEAMNEQLRLFIEELKQLMIQQQGETKNAMNETIKKVLSELEIAIKSIAEERNKQIEQDQRRTSDLTASTTQLYGGLSENVSKLIEDIKLSTIKTEENINQIQKVSTTAISGMNDGAINMKLAAEKFTDAGNAVTDVLEGSRTITTQMDQAAQSLQGTTSIIKDLLFKYEESRQASQSYVRELTELIATAKREAGVSEKIVADMQRIMDTLSSTEKLSTEYLDKVNQVLASSFEKFNSEMLAQVTKINSENDKLMASSIGALRAAVETMVSSTLMLREDKGN